jgi:hypothetical protein
MAPAGRISGVGARFRPSEDGSFVARERRGEHRRVAAAARRGAHPAANSRARTQTPRGRPGSARDSHRSETRPSSSGPAPRVLGHGRCGHRGRRARRRPDPLLDARHHEEEQYARDDPQRDIRRPPPSILATLPHGPMMHRKRSACNGGGGTTHGAAPAAIHATMRQASREPSACAGGILTRRSLDVTRRTSSLQCGRSGKTSVRRASRSAS